MMKPIYLTVDAEHFQFGQLAKLVAHALHPLKDDATVAEMAANGATQIDWEAKLIEAVRSGALPVKNPVTLLPHSFPMGHALQSAIVVLEDLRLFVKKHNLEIKLEKQKLGEDSPWTIEKLEELRAYRAKHTCKDTANHFETSEQTIRKHLKRLRDKEENIKTSPFKGL